MESLSYNFMEKSKCYIQKGSDVMAFDTKQEQIIHRAFLLSMAETSLKDGLIDVGQYNQVIKLIEKKYGRTATAL